MRSSVFLAKQYLSLASVQVPPRWTDPQPLERATMEYDDEIAGGFLKWFPQLDLANKDVLDLGCGYGGRTVRYSELGAKSIVGFEVAARFCLQAKQLAEAKGLTNAQFIVAAGESLPFPDKSFDIITSNDVFEHVADLEATLLESVRVLRTGGTLYAVFPPFYHPTGAHLNDFISWMPWPNVLFRPDTLMEAVIRTLQDRKTDYRPTRMRPNDRMWCLNGATIRSVTEILGRLNKIAHADLELAPLLSPRNSRWKKWRMRYYAPLFRPLPRLPWVREMFTHRMVLRLTRHSD
jgi:SAM-dependent methyltransferase